MESVALPVFVRKMRTYFDKVNRSGMPLLISCGQGKDVVLLSKGDYNSIHETLHLLKSPKNALRLLKSIEADKKSAGSIEE